MNFVESEPILCLDAVEVSDQLSRMTLELSKGAYKYVICSAACVIKQNSIIFSW